MRSLNREIGSVMRSIAKNVATEITYDKNVKASHLEDMLGPSKYSKEKFARYRVPGVCVGLAWTRVGGDILFIENQPKQRKGKTYTHRKFRGCYERICRYGIELYKSPS